MKKKQPLSNFSIEEQERSQKSAMVFKGRLLLINFYLSNRLTTPNEDQQGIEVPDQQLLALIPDFAERGLDAASEYLSFTTAGINIGYNEAGYGHQSREKLAILHFIISFELGRPFYITNILRDELMRIKLMSDLVEWINNLKYTKDVAHILESKHQHHEIQPLIPLHPAVPSEGMLSIKELAAELGISEKTIRRKPEQFAFHLMGKRKFYYLSECKPKYNK